MILVDPRMGSAEVLSHQNIRYANMYYMAFIDCYVCGQTISVRPSYIKGRRHKFCSQVCYLKYRSSDEVIFWSHVLIADGCWLWTGPTNKAGYGYSTQNIYAHRRSYEIHYGPIPSGGKVRHSCHNPPCVNPDHLSLGSTQDNSDDMKNSGRSLVGVRNNKAKLDDDSVRDIIKRYIRGDKAAHIALDYGVSPSSISRITVGKGWTHVEMPQ